MLGEQTAQETSSPSADRRAHRDLSTARCTAREQQARHVRARHEQYETHRAKQEHEWAPRVARHHLVDGTDGDLPTVLRRRARYAVVARIGRDQLAVDTCEIT